mmetsp:Transcript_60479/g.167562  ORF Transcript_60479/g.167562 Transcript_60479/m.167562 type:complete len:279 (-) Transcript_60479:108-944(-)|eukprot:CAMPEP_0179201514 /NCGR_PEP_ID=MMETSP0796-20121207/100293_1 /TAXON_ID=73915 /ORGANISM="Pyrodinium bahamense, Strain pbaha01" /LENGTH=278 /DNA_ID=CAMNT_0020906075 /DNA_START=36 /DNA_END=872 /DNA_ORIENTATION=-
MPSEDKASTKQRATPLGARGPAGMRGPAPLGPQPQDSAAPLPEWAQAADAGMEEVKVPSRADRMESPPIKVHASADLSCRLDLDELCHAFVNCELGRKPTAPLFIYLRGPPSRVKVVEDGRIDFVGTCSVDEAHQTLKRVARRCLKAGFAVKFKWFEIRQVSWAQAYDLRSTVNLLKLARHSGAEAFLEATRPHVRVSCGYGDMAGVEASSIQVAVYATGKVWFHGAHSEDELWRALSSVLPVLEECRSEKIDLGRKRRHVGARENRPSLEQGGHRGC